MILSRLSSSFQNAEVFFATDIRGLKVIADDEDWNVSVSRNDDGSRRPVFDIGSMAAFLSNKAKSGSQKNSLKRLPMDWSQLCHRRSGADSRGALFNCHAVRSTPIPTRDAFIAGFFEHFIQGPVLRRSRKEKSNRFIERRSSLVCGRTRTCDIQRHGVGEILAAFLPDLHRIPNFHRLQSLTNRSGFQSFPKKALARRTAT